MSGDDAQHLNPPDVQPLSRRMWMRRALDTTPLPTLDATPDSLRSVTTDDVEGLAALMLDAYIGTVDFEGDETLDDARDQVLEWLNGRPDLAASRVIERDGALVSACLVSLREGVAYLAFVMTRQAFTRQGLAAAVMLAALHDLHARGVTDVRLGVTRANVGAVRVYTRLGFSDFGPIS